MPEDVNQLLTDLTPVHEKWREIGLELGVQEHDLNRLQSLVPRPVDRLRAIISSWQSTLRDRAAWSAIVDALKSRRVNAPRLAAQLQIKHCQSGAAGNIEEIKTEGKEESRLKNILCKCTACTYVRTYIAHDRSRDFFSSHARNRYTAHTNLATPLKFTSPRSVPYTRRTYVCAV